MLYPATLFFCFATCPGGGGGALPVCPSPNLKSCKHLSFTFNQNIELSLSFQIMATQEGTLSCICGPAEAGAQWGRAAGCLGFLCTVWGFFFLLVVVLGIEPRAAHRLGTRPGSELHPQPCDFSVLCNKRDVRKL